MIERIPGSGSEGSPGRAGHPHWCNGPGESIDCTGPQHAWALDGIVAAEGLYSVVISQPVDDPVVSIVGDEVKLTLALDQVERLLDIIDRAAIIGRGEWPEFRVL
jgi:hypothetical protein